MPPAARLTARPAHLALAALPFAAVWLAGGALFAATEVPGRWSYPWTLVSVGAHLAFAYVFGRGLARVLGPGRAARWLTGGLYVGTLAWTLLLVVTGAISIGHWNGVPNVDLFADLYRNAWFYLRELVGAEAYQIVGAGLLGGGLAAAGLYLPVRAFAAATEARVPRAVRWGGVAVAAVLLALAVYALTRPVARRAQLRRAFLLSDPVGYFYYEAYVRGRIHEATAAAERAQAPTFDSLVAAAPPPPRGELPNVVVVTVDALTRDFVGAYGAPASVTPVIDSLVAAGPHVFVAEGLANYNSSAGGILSIQQGHFMGDELRRYPSLADYLRAYGYRTAFLLGGNHTAYYGLTRYYGSHVDYLRQAAGVGGYGDTDDRAVVAALRTYLREGAPGPHYLNLHLMSAHETRRLFRRRPIPPDAVAHLRGLVPATAETAEDYLLGVAQADAVVGDLVHVLDSAGVLDDALVVLTADHGEGFRPDGRREHGAAYAASQFDIPIVLLGTALPAVRGARDTVAMASQLDIAPTIAEVLGLPAHPAWRGTSLLRAADAHIAPLNVPEEDFYRVRVRSAGGTVELAFDKPPRGATGAASVPVGPPRRLDPGGGPLPDSGVIARARALLAQP